MAIPREFIQEVLTRIDIVELIDARVPLQKKSAQNFFACCPFHTEKSASFSVSHSKQFYHCFGCGAHGNAIDFLMQYDRLNFPEAVEALAKTAGLEVPHTETHATKKTIAPDLYTLLEKIAGFYQQTLRKHLPAIDYLKKRGLTGEIAKTFGIGYAPNGWDNLLKAFTASRQHLHEVGMLIQKEDQHYHDRFRDRIMFPIRDRRGRIIGFGGRVIHQGEPKYLNSPETPLFHKGRELYGLYEAQQANRTLKYILIVEGYMDVIALFQHGVTYAVATMGTATTANHIQRLFRYTNEIIFCFDGDNAGRTAAWRALQTAFPLAQDGKQMRFMFLPDGDDPDSFIRRQGRETFETKIQEAQTLSQFFFHALSTQVDLSHLDGRAHLAKLAMEHIQQLPEGIFKTFMLDELAKRTRINTTQFQPKKTQQKNILQPTQSRPTTQLRRVIMLLLQQPTLAQHIQLPLPDFDQRGGDILKTLLDRIQSNPKITTGALLEQWRDQTDYASLVKLAATEHMIPEEGIEEEFKGAISRLRLQSQKQHISKLLAKAATTPLTGDEKSALQTLISESQGEQ
ncbi:MAG: DNA primase [Gammaproteobacteria bacterium]|nr:DNA primase [Gammaproteobacteria bacterium]